MSRAELHGDEGLPRLREQITAELEGCTITEVVSTVAQTAGEAAVHEGAITRQQYEVSAGTRGQTCVVAPLLSFTLVFLLLPYFAFL